MLSEKLNIDVQIHQEEVKKPNHSSIVLLPLKYNSGIVHQLELRVTYSGLELTPKQIDSASQIIFREWQSIFPLYGIQRAFADMIGSNETIIYITFDATNIFSNTQLRNIKRTITELLEVELNQVYNQIKEKQAKKIASVSHDTYDFSDKFNQLKQENNELQMMLQNDIFGDQSQSNRVNDLRKELTRQQDSLSNFSGAKHNNEEINGLYNQVQETLEHTSQKLNQTQQDLMDKQREIQRLQSLVMENERYINGLQSDYDKLAESSYFQLQHTLEENDVLKHDLDVYKQNELSDQQEVQRIKSELGQLLLETENSQEELRQRLQRTQYENQELRTVIQENQQFEEKIHQELLETTKELSSVKDALQQLELEKGMLNQEWTTRYNNLSMEKENLALSYKASLEVEAARNTELIDLKSQLIELEQRLQKNDLDKKQIETNWQSRLLAEEREKERLVQQITNDKEQFLNNKEQEIKRLSDRLAQQNQLVDKLMSNQSDSQSVWQENTEALETNYQASLKRISELELEVLSLTEKNKLLLAQLAEKEPMTDLDITASLVPVTEVVAPVEDIIVSVEEPKEDEKVETVSEDTYYDDEESDYDYDDSDYDYDYDYDYHEVDDLVNYNPDSIEEDIDELLDNKDEEGKSKIAKKDYEVYELYLDHLPELLEQGKAEEFYKYVEPKMKKFKKFKRDFEDDVKSPTLFSRKYKMETGLANQMKAYVLMSRHLSVLLDVEISDDEYYDYDYGYDYDYDYDYEYDED